MKETKFRAWDVNEDVYIPWEKLIRICYNQEYLQHLDKTAPNLSFMTDKYLIKEEYTGFIDNSGNEWYENDLITNNNVIYKIVWDKEKFTWALVNYHHDNYSPIYLSQLYCTFNYWGNDVWIKIGNIHENSESIKG